MLIPYGAICATSILEEQLSISKPKMEIIKFYKKATAKIEDTNTKAKFTQFKDNCQFWYFNMKPQDTL